MSQLSAMEAKLDSQFGVTGACAEFEQLQQQQLHLVKKLMSSASGGTRGDQGPVGEKQIREILRARRHREACFGSDLFADPAWDIMLELYGAELAQQRLSISAVAGATAVPQTTVLRWIDRLINDGLVAREGDKLDRRRIWLSLTPAGSAGLQRYFEGCRFLPV